MNKHEFAVLSISVFEKLLKQKTDTETVWLTAQPGLTGDLNCYFIHEHRNVDATGTPRCTYLTALLETAPPGSSFTCAVDNKQLTTNWLSFTHNTDDVYIFTILPDDKTMSIKRQATGKAPELLFTVPIVMMDSPLFNLKADEHIDEMGILYNKDNGLTIYKADNTMAVFTADKPGDPYEIYSVLSMYSPKFKTTHVKYAKREEVTVPEPIAAPAAVKPPEEAEGRKRRASAEVKAEKIEAAKRLLIENGFTVGTGISGPDPVTRLSDAMMETGVALSALSNDIWVKLLESTADFQQLLAKEAAQRVTQVNTEELEKAIRKQIIENLQKGI